MSKSIVHTEYSASARAYPLSPLLFLRCAYFLRLRGDLHAKDEDGYTPLRYAKEHNRVEVPREGTGREEVSGGALRILATNG